MAQFGTPVQTSLVTRVSLSFSCKGLLDGDILSKSDSAIQVMMECGGKWTEVREKVLMFLVLLDETRECGE